MRLICFLLLFVGTVSAYDAPLGLDWGQTKEELEKDGVEFTDCKTKLDFMTCNIENPPKTVSFGEIYLVRFHVDEGLQWVTILSNKIEGDIIGKKGKELYSTVKNSLTNKYSEPALNKEVSGRKLYDEYDEFYQCLKYSGCGLWASAWKIEEGGNIMVQLIGVSRGVGMLKLTYDSPNWGRLLDKMNSDKISADQDSL